MDRFSQEQIRAIHGASQVMAGKLTENQSRSVAPCNFRSAGRLSNESARLLTAAHETLARHLASAFEVFLATGLEVKLLTIDQLPAKEYIAGVLPLSYIAPLSSNTTSSTMIVELDVGFIFPIIDLLMGGTGNSPVEKRELSEIEEEIMQDVMLLIARQIENTWHLLHESLVPNRRTKASVLHQYCPPHEKVTFARFEVNFAGQVGSFQLVFPAAFLNELIKQLKLDQPQTKGRARNFPMPDIRERILDCEVDLATDLLPLRVAVRELLMLRPGSILNLRAPVGHLCAVVVEGRPIFEVEVAKVGSRKAVQLGEKIPIQAWGRE